jgi:hypothetical protein
MDYTGTSDHGLVERKSPFVINRDGIAVATPALRKRLLAQHTSGLCAVCGDPLRGQEFLTTFHLAKYDDRHDMAVGFE